MSLDFKKIWPHLVSIVIFIVLASMYFAPQLQGKKIQQSDIMQYRGMASEVRDYKDQNEIILWTNSMFGGMPSYQIGAPQVGNLTQHVFKATGLFISRPIGMFLSAMVVFYLAMLLMKVDPWIALVGAIGFGFTTNLIVLFEAGHTSKINSLIVGILVLVGLIRTFRKDYWVGGIVFAIGLAMNLWANHFQMTYYLAMACGLLVIYYLIESIRNKELSQFGKSLIFIVLGSVIALGTSASKLLTTYEYSKSTMRGEPILELTDDRPAASSSETDGLEWGYSMGWSNGVSDIMASMIPGVTGGGSSEPIGKSSATNQFLRRQGAQSLEYGPMYWGQLPFTSGPIYMGAVCIFLFLLSLFILPSNLKWWALATVLLTFALSMGKNLEFLSRFFYDYVPMYNKFRSPSSITGVTAIVIVMMGVLGLNHLRKEKEAEVDMNKYVRPLLISGGILSAICLFYALLGPSFFDFSSPSDARYAQSGFDTSVFEDDRKAIMRRDAFRSLLLILLSCGTIFFMIKSKIKMWIGLLILTALTAYDLLGVDARYVNSDSFVSSRQMRAFYDERPVDKQIKQDKSLHYRVHDLTKGNPFENSWTSYHHKTLGGYHAAKLQRIQDVIDFYLTKGDQKYLHMLNVKYIITGQPGQEQVVQNPEAYGNAWFVNEFQYVDTQRKELTGVENIDPSFTALIHQSFKNELPESNSQLSKGTIRLTSYHPDKLVYNSNNSGEGLALFSEVWYGPDKGWKLTIDGEEVPIIRANYLMRAAVIPAGEHEIIMEFHPSSYYGGEIISWICSILLFGGIGFVGYKKWKEKDDDNEEV